MKRILFLVGLFIYTLNFGQSTYQNLGSTFGNNISRVNSLNGFQLPRGADTSLKGSLDTVGMLFYKTTDTSLWLRVPKVSGVGNMWKKLNFSAGTIGNTIYTGDGSLPTDRNINGNSHNLTFHNTDTFKVKSNQFWIDSRISSQPFEPPHGLFLGHNTDSSKYAATIGASQSHLTTAINDTMGQLVIQNNGGDDEFFYDINDKHDNFSGLPTNSQLNRLTILSPHNNNYSVVLEAFDTDSSKIYLTNGGDGSSVMYNSWLSRGNTDTFATRRYADSVAGGGGSSQWTTTGTDIANNNSGNVTIKGTYYPSGLFQVNDSLRSVYVGDFNGLFGTYNGTYSETNDQAECFKWYCKDYYTNPLMQLNGNGSLLMPHLTNSVSDKQLMYNSITGEVTFADTATGYLTSAVTAVTSTYPLQYTNSTTTPNITADTGRGNNQIATGGDLTKVKDSLGSVIATKVNKSDSIAGGYYPYSSNPKNYLTSASLTGYVPYSTYGTNNVSANNFFDGFSSVAASGTQITLTVNSTPSYLVTGSGGQTIKLPDATTLPNGTLFNFNNNQSSGAILVNNNSNTLVKSVPSGGNIIIELIDNSIAAGSWDAHSQAPSNVSWSTNTFTYGGSFTGGTWNGNVIGILYGGTGASTAAAARTNLGSTTVGDNFFTLTNPSAKRFTQINADNTVSTLDSVAFRTAIGAGTSSTNGTVTSVSTTNGVGITSSVATATTTPNITIAVDTSNTSILSRQRAAATYTAGAIDSIRLANTDIIFTTPAAFSKVGTTGVITQTLANQTAYKVLWNNTGSSAAPAFNYLDTLPFNNKFGTYVQAAQIPSNTYTAGRGTTLTSSAFGLDTTKSYYWTGFNRFDSIRSPKIIGGTGINDSLVLQSTTNPSATNPNNIFFKCWSSGILATVGSFTGTTGSFNVGSITGLSNPFKINATTGGQTQFYAGGTYLGAISATGLSLNVKLSANYNAAPSANLQIGGGTTSASSAPLKINTGSLMTTPEVGAIEYDGTNLFATNSTATRFTLAKTLTATATLDFASTAASSSTDLTITVTGAADGDAVSIGVPNASTNANSCFTAWVSAANTVTIRFNNYQTVGSINPASGTFRASVIKY